MVSEYKKAGVDLNKLKEYHTLALNTFQNSGVLKIGHYANAIKLDDKYLAMHVDGVGTKTILALKTGIIEPTGIDCIAMNVNDLVCIGARPLAGVDYLALEKPMDDVVEKVMKGLKQGADEANIEIIGGETAIMPGVITGYDLSCSVIGISDRLKTGEDVAPGDVILGLKSNGVHSNGYSLIRKLIDEGKLSLNDWGEELMRPTRIYSSSIIPILDKIKALAHITGGAFSKLKRITNYRINLKMPDPPEVFKAIENAGVPHFEMYKIFNMGIGMIIFVSKDLKDDIIEFLSKKETVYELGYVEKGEGIKITTYKNEILYI
ncbi:MULTISPECIES: phosphoribosylformylglycinamidine cyclo-ligase [Sulfurisphaera]|uniref:Phosphoribosylformylglycinamidine cyclo-ligase n=3 Tax=Sulfurisphaera TaxID=69655 RepID=PUR5_SULTO|nr:MULTISPECIES: phosphoribosylformylglycinamidine cyclo-ligase [Sulfurisphaera]Q970V2.1 RecName: Full=Phosphoribosylformylglycinamidine cyclo-ligase; AltName: Full=AIR synthase; AltName: Full=AIRS; AltName: Full=Phosphoribosyl-aminoimidazole synthetase [Sulfurisphaera tokodaii str. 7]QGR18463.1 phosphoribosylformylglycinamidine cyclo-ligase [Sulfurisphaera ohwakuensis]BAK54605.1 phosphoribosylformylglycinamidine cyclo-ligase [Sulfurisphaera tokodaii str. 7]HII73613.1 phosphoribosylformylglycin